MTNGTFDRFTPRGTLSREDLMAYAEGRLDPAAAHEVELHLEADPLLRDAMEGLQQPGALQGLHRLRAHAPQAGGNAWLGWTASITAIAIVSGAVYLFVGNEPSPQVLPAMEQVTMITVPEPPAALPHDAPELAAAEILTATEIPESLHIGHADTERHSIAQANTLPREAPVERTTPDPVPPKPTALPGDAAHHAPTVAPARRPSLQLIYLHGLKLLHPKEMYGRSPDIGLLTTSVDARFATAAEQRAAHGEERRIAYLAFMDEALDKFVHNDHKGCLEELRYVLSQYPDDVNALFYAGLCCYNLGMDRHAERFLGRAATHVFNVFDEEAEWYHALALERSGKPETARSELERIARSTSFYADRAKSRVTKGE